MIQQKKFLDWVETIPKEHWVTVDTTPTWSGLMRAYLTILRTERHTKRSKFVEEEMVNMARVADAHVELHKENPIKEDRPSHKLKQILSGGL